MNPLIKPSLVGIVVIVIMIIGTAILFKKFSDDYRNKVVPQKESNQKTIDTLLHVIIEKSYFEGQKDILNGQIHINQEISGSDTTYSWKDSPWDDKTPPVYNPSEFNSKGK